MAASGDKNCVNFLRQVLPDLNLRWEGYRKVRRQVCRRIRKRIHVLKLESFEAYRIYLKNHSREREVLDGMMHISISRFFRDTHSWDLLGEILLPALAQRAALENRPLRCWSAGCASGEEPYSLALLWKHKLSEVFSQLPLQIIATDANELMLQRAQRASYSRGSLKHVPVNWLNDNFLKQGEEYFLNTSVCNRVSFHRQDIRKEMPEGKFDLVFCKNLVGMYFEKPLAIEVFTKIVSRMHSGSYLLLGNHEPFPLEEVPDIVVFNKGLQVYQKKTT